MTYIVSLLLTPEMKQMRDDDTRARVPRFADKIIDERRKIRKWVIQKASRKDPTQIWPTELVWSDKLCATGDEEDAGELIFMLKATIPPGFMRDFRKKEIESHDL